MRARLNRYKVELFQRFWNWATLAGCIDANSRRAKGFARFGEGSLLLFPMAALFNENYIEIGANTMLGPYSSLSAGMVPGQVMLGSPVLKIGDRCSIGRSSSIVAHLSIQIGDDVWTGPNVYITDQNHDYTDITRPIGAQSMPEAPVSIGSNSWLGTNVVILPGAHIGRHVTIGASSVVVGDIPDYSVAVGSPARVVRRYDHDSGRWVSVAAEP
jgi:carbonic anhydrase/acetyltransferase-like protein (isoleucine patch superfamily)